VTPITGNVTVAFAVLSYAGTLRVTVTVDPRCCPDLPALVARLQDELDLIATDQRPDPAPEASTRVLCTHCIVCRPHRRYAHGPGANLLRVGRASVKQRRGSRAFPPECPTADPRTPTPHVGWWWVPVVRTRRS
jgi:hypothetical protein